MGVSRKRAWVNVERLMARPRRELRLVLRHGKQGVTLLHEGKALTRCYRTKVGMACAKLMAEALGVALPPPGGQVEAVVPNGVLYRAVSLSSLDLRVPGTEELADRLLEEAAFQRQRAGGAPAE
ncbi:MAG: hypothetical protein EXR48_00350 [Dehalococcoidia bacterium]|nr:hypothetical protein [Dehalococcoidia bacterium]